MKSRRRQKYFDHYRLEVPRIPLLVPEFSLPLFLRLYCESLRGSGQTDAAAGHEGRVRIFERYLDAKLSRVARRLRPAAATSYEIENAKSRASKVVDALLDEFAATGREGVRSDRAEELATAAMSGSSDDAAIVLGALQSEGILTRELLYFGDDSTHDGFRLVFQAFADYLILRRRLVTLAEPMSDAALRQWLREDCSWGIVEAAAVSLPELYGVELPDFLGVTASEPTCRPSCSAATWLAKFPGFVPPKMRSLLLSGPSRRLDVTVSHGWGRKAMQKPRFVELRRFCGGAKPSWRQRRAGDGGVLRCWWTKHPRRWPAADRDSRRHSQLPPHTSTASRLPMSSSEGRRTRRAWPGSRIDWSVSRFDRRPASAALGRTKAWESSCEHLRKSPEMRRRDRYARPMSLAEVLDDLLELQELAQDEGDPKRRRALDEVRAHVARRERGAKVSEAAAVLGISQPTVRAWIESGVLMPMPGTKPVRIDVLALAETKRALDLIREHADDGQLLVHVMRVLRDRSALQGEGVREGFDDLAAGRVVPLSDDLLDEIAVTEGKARSRSKST